MQKKNLTNPLGTKFATAKDNSLKIGGIWLRGKKFRKQFVISKEPGGECFGEPVAKTATAEAIYRRRISQSTLFVAGFQGD